MKTPAASPQGPLAGIVVIDLATERAELSGRVLADLGAEVIKVEPPDGSAARRLPPFEEGRRGDPDGSLYWASVALGKRSVVLDLAVASGRERLRRLLAGADIFVESFDPGTLDRLGLGYEAVRRINPGLVYVSVTPYGQSGPDALSPATELTIEAAGGLLGLQGDGDRPPVPVGFPQAAFHAGVQAAADALIALNERQRSGRGQHLDVSMQAAMVWTLLNATGYPPLAGGDPPHTGEDRAGPPLELLPGLSIPLLWECADGAVHGVLGVVGDLGGRTFQAFMRWMEEEGAVDPALARSDWRAWLPDVVAGRLSVEQANRGIAAVLAFVKGKTKQELMKRARAEHLLIAPVLTVAEILTDAQLVARQYWQQVGARLHPGPFARLSRTPIELGAPAPALSEGQSLLDEPRPAATAAVPANAPRAAACAGLKVADFAWVGVGPLISKALADHGATVVHVESMSRPDILRLLPPFKDNVPGVNRSFMPANFNTSKLGLALDLSTNGGRTLARRLIDWADVVVESFTPGTMEQWCLDYETVSKDRPDLVMLSTSLRGATGPDRTYPGFGGHGSALAGLHSITGWPDRLPCGPWAAYTDFIAPRYGLAALAAALFHRSRTGLGQHIDLAQVEAAIHFIEPLVLDYTVNGRVAEPAGHHSPRACPHGVYLTAGVERYLALAVESAAQWRALRSVAPLDSFGQPELDDLAARLARRDAIDEALRAWARDQDPWELAQQLKGAGVPAAVVLRPSDLYDDPQLRHREFFVTLDHGEMGRVPFNGFVTRFSETPPQLRKAAPCLGEDTDYVLRQLLGLAPEEIAEYAAAGALT